MRAWTPMLLGIAAVSGCPDPVEIPTPITPAETNPVATVLAALEEADGVTIEQGRVEPMTEQACQQVVVDGVTCPGGRNLSSPLGMWTVPGDLPSEDGNLVFQLGHDQALVYVGNSPPEGRYFSYTLYQYRRQLPNGEDFFGRGSIAPSLNHRTIHVDPAADSPYSAFTVIVVATNNESASRVLALLEPALDSVEMSTAVNVLPIPARSLEDTLALLEDPTLDPTEVLHLRPGHGPFFDHYMVAYRSADPVDFSHPFFDEHTAEGSLVRLTLSEPSTPTPFAYPLLPPPSFTGELESQALKEAQDAVAGAAARRFGQAPLSAVITGSANEERKNGFACNNGFALCFLNSDDARYIREEKTFRFSGDEASVFVVGVVHDDVQLQESGAADVSYSNLSVVDRLNGAATAASLMDRELRSSARAWFPDGVLGVTDDVLDLLYVVKVARVCEAADPLCIQVEDADIGVGEQIGITERTYLNEVSHTAPDASTVRGPVLVGIGPQIEVHGSWIELD